MARTSGTEAHREKILKAALSLLSKHGRDAVTTRDVAEAAKVQPPVLYRLFEDKNGLLDAVAAYGFKAYITKKQPLETGGDPVEALRTGWDAHVEFGLAHPELYLLMYANPRPGIESLAAQQASGMLSQHMRQVAVAGRLRMSVERSCALFHAAACGIVMLLLSRVPDERDPEISAFARDHALQNITTDAQPARSSTRSAVANQMLELLSKPGEEKSMFSNAEQSMLSEWLQRLGTLSS